MNAEGQIINAQPQIIEVEKIVTIHDEEKLHEIEAKLEQEKEEIRLAAEQER
jgi:hypothetical protein